MWRWEGMLSGNPKKAGVYGFPWPISLVKANSE